MTEIENEDLMYTFNNLRYTFPTGPTVMHTKDIHTVYVHFDLESLFK